MNKRKIARNIIASVVDFDMHNLFPTKDYAENMEDAESGSYESQPRPTLRERQYNPSPLIVLPKYEGDFLEKLRKRPELQGKPLEVEASNPENLWDFDMPSEWLKHQEQPHPRVLLDLFYDMNKPGDQAGYEDLKQYHDRGWDSFDSPEMSEDKYLRYSPGMDSPHRIPLHGAAVHNVIATYLMNYIPVDIVINTDNIKTAMLLGDFTKTSLTTKEKGTRKPDVGGVTVKLARAEPRVGRWTFSTTSGTQPYTTIFQFIPHGTIRDTTKLHVRISCSCPSWLFWGAQYHAIMKDYLYGKIRPKFAPPKKRDPKGNFLVCKHILACIPLISRYKIEKMPEELKERIKKEPKYKVIEKIPVEELKIPKELEGIGQRGKIEAIVKDWVDNPRKRRGWIMKLNDPEEVIYFAHRFPETATAFVAERLKQLAMKPATKKEALEFLGELDEIEGAAPIKEIKIPANLKKFESDIFLQEQEKMDEKYIEDQTDPDKLAYIAYKYHDDTDLVSNVIKKLKEISDNMDDHMEQDRKKAEHWIGEIA